MGTGSVEERMSSASTLPVPVGLSGWTLNLTVLDDEFRMATIGRVASCAVVEFDVAATPAGSAGM